MMNPSSVVVRFLGQQAYADCWQAMKAFTDQRTEDTEDEFWVVEHPPVFTLGQNGKTEHILDAGEIPVLPVDRGGQITYHGPGQVVIYTLVDVKRKKYNVRQLVNALEQAIIQLLAAYGVEAKAKCEAPGVYVKEMKIASVGLRIRRGCAYHGLALNVAMDLSPFTRINPCGYAQLKMTQLADLSTAADPTQVGAQLIEYLIAILGYTTPLTKTERLYGTYQSE